MSQSNRLSGPPKPGGYPLLTWMHEERLAACVYPTSIDDLAELASLSVTHIVNLHEQSHQPAHLEQHKLTQVHLPVIDMTPPSAEQLEQGVQTIREALESGGKVVVHCAAGLGRTGTLIACYFVDQGMTADRAVARVRELRPGSLETETQVAAVRAFEQNRLSGKPPSDSRGA